VETWEVMDGERRTEASEVWVLVDLDGESSRPHHLVGVVLGSLVQRRLVTLIRQQIIRSTSAHNFALNNRERIEIRD
jgi:hypothetical protein